MFYAKAKPLFSGLALVLALGALATLIGRVFPLLGGAVAGIVLGIAWRWRGPLPPACLPGIGFAARQLLQWSIVALGLGLPIMAVARTGMDSLSVTLATVAASFLSALLFGKLLRVPTKLCVLIGSGTAICGGSAIAAIAPIVEPEAHETAFSLSTIFLFNVLAVLLFPLLGHLLGLSERGFGLWAGTAINDTSSVVAAAYAWSSGAGEYATIVKLTRAMLIIPLALILAALASVRQGRGEHGVLRSALGAVPWFIVCFVVASALGQFLPEVVGATAQWIAPLMITAALTAVGLSTDLARMRETGWRPVVLGLLVWFSVAATSLLVQHATGRW